MPMKYFTFKYLNLNVQKIDITYHLKGTHTHPEKKE